MTTTSTTAWPDATNTGVPAGVTLTAAGDPNGILTLSTPGQVVSGLNISGSVDITASNVTLKDCVISAGGFYAIATEPGVTGVTIENCTIDGMGLNGTAGSSAIYVKGGGVSIIGNNIYNAANGVSISYGPVTIQNNFIHDLLAPTDTNHYNGIQYNGYQGSAPNGPIDIEHNTIINTQGQTDAVMIDNYFGPVNNVTVNNNLLSGGDFTIYVSGQFNSNPVTNVSVTNNHLGSGVWGYTDFNGANPVYTGNVTDGATLIQSLTQTGQNTSSGSGGSTSTPPSTPPAAPVISSFSPDSGVVGDGITDANKLTITGTADPNSTITVYDGSTKLGTATASSTGSWDYITSILTDAKHTLTATETNSSGQTSAASAALAVTVDTKAPAAPVLASDSVVNTNHIQVSGTAEANSTVTVYDGTTVVGTGTTSSTGAFSVTTSALSTGTHALTATATDAAGNVSAASQALDPVVGGTSTTPPSTAPTAPHIVSFSPDTGVVGDHITSDNTPTVAGTAVANSTVTLFDGTTQIATATADANGQWSLTTKALSDGTHSLTATDTDSSGHTSTASAAFAVTVDTHVPNAPTMAAYSQGGSAVGHTTSLNDLVLKGAAEANSTIHIFDSGNQIGTATTSSAGSWSFDTGHLANGGHSFTSTAVDVAGNASAASAPDAVTVTAPTTTSAATPIDFTNVSYPFWDHTATIQGTADAYSQVKLYDGTTLLGQTTASAKGTWSWTNSQLYNDTLHTITAQEVDSTGHVVGTSSGAAMIMGSYTSTLTGTGGDDFMYSSSSSMNDTFAFANNFGHSTIQGFTASGPGHDTVQFSTSVFDSFASVLSHASQVGQDVVISSGNDTLKLLNTKLSALNSQDFHFA